jgi:hypothetical protein
MTLSTLKSRSSKLSNLDAHEKPHEPKGHAFQRPLAVPIRTVNLPWKQVLEQMHLFDRVTSTASQVLLRSIYTRALIFRLFYSRVTCTLFYALHDAMSSRRLLDLFLLCSVFGELLLLRELCFDKDTSEYQADTNPLH